MILVIAIAIACFLALAGSAFGGNYKCPGLKKAKVVHYLAYDVKGRLSFLFVPVWGFEFSKAIHLKETENNEEKAVCVFGKLPFSAEKYQVEGVVFSKVNIEGGEEYISIKYKVGRDEKSLKVRSLLNTMAVSWEEDGKFLPYHSYSLEGNNVHNGVFAFLAFLRKVELSRDVHETAFPLNKGLYRARVQPRKEKRGIILKVLLFPVKIVKKEEELENVEVLVRNGEVVEAYATYRKYGVITIKARLTQSR